MRAVRILQVDSSVAHPPPADAKIAAVRFLCLEHARRRLPGDWPAWGMLDAAAVPEAKFVRGRHPGTG